MKTTPSPQPTPASGYALITTLLFLAVMLVGFASIMNWAATSTMNTQRNNLYVSAQAAAESDTEIVIATMMRDFRYDSLHSAGNYTSLVPATNGWPVLCTFQNTNGTANQTSVSIGPGEWSELPTPYSGLGGHGQDCVIASTATTVGQRYAVSSTVSQSVWFGTIPLFQFAIFYNLDMEINPGASMIVNGHVHSNYNIWATGSSSGSPLVFNGPVDAAGFVTNDPSPLDPQNYGNRSGNVNYNDTNSPVSNADALTLPIGNATNDNPVAAKAVLNLPPAGMGAPLSSAYTTSGQTYLYNQADLIISNSPYGINGDSSTNVLTVYYQNPNRTDPLTVVPPDVPSVQTVVSNSYTTSLANVTNMIPTTTYVTNVVTYTYGRGRHRITITTTNVTPQTTYAPQVTTEMVTNTVSTYLTTTNYTYYSFITNQTFYDYREQKTVQAVQVDVAKLNVWLTNSSSNGGLQYQQLNDSGSTSKGHDINSIYVYNSVAENSSTLPAVRMTDGAELPSAGLSVATPMPIYVMGNYNVTTDGIHYSEALGNTTYTYPAALMGDAITLLSGNWNDNWNASTPLSLRTPVDANTTLNAATMEGIVPSDGSHYSGGVENFLRLLENWSGHTITYNGSIVVMFPSQYATSPWSYGTYYTAPTRDWGFDANFEDPAKLPPMELGVKALIRSQYVSN